MPELTIIDALRDLYDAGLIEWPEEPDFHPERGAAMLANMEAHDPVFKKWMDEGRAKAAAARARGPD
jgi:hypothetical protein